MWKQDGWRWVLFLVLAEAGLGGCSKPYMPMDDYELAVDVNMIGVRFFPHYTLMVCTSYPAECGQRKVDEDRYELDSVIGELVGFEFPVSFIPSGKETPLIREGCYGTVAAGDSPNFPPERAWLAFNDYGKVEVNMPSSFAIKEPAHQLEEFSRSKDQAIRFSWDASGSDFLIHWRTQFYDNGLDGDPCNTRAWASVSGLQEDIGSFEIPMDAFPKDIPAEGCGVVVIVSRRSLGQLPSGIPKGFIHGDWPDQRVIRIVP